MKKTAILIEKLIRLANGDVLPASSLKGDWFEQMLEDGILLATTHGSRKSLRAIDGMSLRQYVASQYDIYDLELWWLSLATVSSFHVELSLGFL